MKTIEELAREAGATIMREADYIDIGKGEVWMSAEELARFAAAVRREALEDTVRLIAGYPHWLGENAKREVIEAIRSLQSPTTPEGQVPPQSAVSPT